MEMLYVSIIAIAVIVLSVGTPIFAYDEAKPCCINSVNNTLHVISPLKQFESGVAPKDIQCKNNLILIFKVENGYPACVKQDTVKKLVRIGWAFSVDVLPQNMSNKMLNGIQQQPYANMTITGLKENYTLNEPITFSIIIEGYGTGCGDTTVTITKEKDSQYKSTQWGSTASCTSNTKQNYFKFNALSINTSINQTGNYILTASFNDLITSHDTKEEKRFTVDLSKNSIR